MMFIGRQHTSPEKFDTPADLYDQKVLRTNQDAVDDLWKHQRDALDLYAEQHRMTPDLAIEMPTGAGKTLPGLLIAEWARREFEEPVLYATPTQQLAKQVHSTSVKEGIPSKLLIGPSRDWNVRNESSVAAAESVGVTTYNSIFNSSPKVPHPGLIIFDDAHAGEQFVGQKYCVNINRHNDEKTYLSVLEALQPYLSELVLQRLRGEPDPGAHQQVRMIQPHSNPRALHQLDATLAELPEPHTYEYSMIRSGISSSCVYVSHSSIQVRPMIPPTHENRCFSQARQRIYLSATLGAGGELERAFGKPRIARLQRPDVSPAQFGRRFFVFPGLVLDQYPEELIQEIVNLDGKALLLSQKSTEKTEELAEEITAPDIPLFGRDDLMENGLADFAVAETGVLSLANRYDGLDLPSDSCRIIVLDGVPDAVSLQEKFLGERVGARAVLAERLRTRIIQGAGRATRGPEDYAVVVVLGNDLVKYFSDPRNLKSLDPEIQAEIKFGWENTKVSSAEQLVKLVRIFLTHDDEWINGGEPRIAEFLDGSDKVIDEAETCLHAAAPTEVEAWHLAFNQDWVKASEKLQKAADALWSDSIRGYRALILYTAGTWLHDGARNETEKARARDLIQEAERASRSSSAWLKEMPSLTSDKGAELEQIDAFGITQIMTLLRSRPKKDRTRKKLKEMQEILSHEDPTPYEQALSTLGEYLGARASKPAGKGRCDSAWDWDTVWLTLEAKSAHRSQGLVPLHDIRQANTQLDQMASDKGLNHPPASSASVIISDKAIDQEHAPVARSHLYLANKAAISSLANDLVLAWEHLLSTATGLEPDSQQRQHVHGILQDHGCLTSQVLERLQHHRIRND